VGTMNITTICVALFNIGYGNHEYDWPIEPPLFTC